MKQGHKRIHVYYSGRVQGVGFRFSVERLAQDLGLVGWVRNRPDGKVEFVGEGEEEALHKILTKIDGEFSSFIRQKNVNWRPATGEFAAFDIKWI